MAKYRYFVLKMGLYVHSSNVAFIRGNGKMIEERHSHQILHRVPVGEVFPNPNVMADGIDLLEDDWLKSNRERLNEKFGGEDMWVIGGSFSSDFCTEITQEDFERARWLLGQLGEYDAFDRLMAKVGADFNKKQLV